MLEINIFSSFLIVFLFGILSFRKNNALPNKILAVTLLIPGLNFMNNVHILSGMIYNFPWSYFFVQVTGSLFAPFAFYYLLLMTNRSASDIPKWMIAVSTLIIIFGLLLGVNFYFLNAIERSNYLEQVLSGPYPVDMIIYSIFVFTHQLIYFTASYVQIKKYKKSSVDHFSSLIHTKLAYLSRFVVLLWVLTLITVILYALFENTTLVEYLYLPLIMIIIILFIIYYAFHSHSIFTFDKYKEHLQNVDFKNEERDQTSAVDSTDQSEENILFSKIVDCIKNRELYKNSDFSVNQLTAIINLPVYKITECMRKNNTTFYELVRKIRVEKAKKYLKNRELQFTVEGVAYEVGFNSRAAFYRAFKKYENKPPTIYLDSKRDSNT